jgi:pyruvate/2-oxoglutarate dehydrogenase complex dihydrolipoamide acyltransferase (E2) component
MVKDVQLPEISENVTSGEVLIVLVGIVDTVANEQAVVEKETEKAAVSIPAPFEGKVKEAHVIHLDKCVKCGACMEKCKFGAISKR